MNKNFTLAARQKEHFAGGFGDLFGG